MVKEAWLVKLDLLKQQRNVTVRSCTMSPSTQHTLYDVQCMLYSVRRMMYIVRRTLYHCTLYNGSLACGENWCIDNNLGLSINTIHTVQCTVYTAYCTLYTA